MQQRLKEGSLELKKTNDLKRLVRSMIEEGWNRGDIAAFEVSLADSVHFHYAGTPRTLTRDDMAQLVLRWREAFPDLRMEVEELLAEGELVAARLTLSGTHRAPWAGVAPTGKRIKMALMMFFRFEGAKMVELWESDDQLGLRRQLGIGT